MSLLINAVALEASVKNFTRELRQLFDERDLSHLRFDIEVNGRVQGDLKIEFKVTDSLYGGDAQTRGGNIQSVVDEFFRRKGWKAINDPLCLTFDERPQAAE
jgi:hypothetical protein